MKRYILILTALILCCCHPEPVYPGPAPDPDPTPQPYPGTQPDPDPYTVIDPSHNVWGYVLCKGKGVKNVVVSDGYELTSTNADGLYSFASAKHHGYVFISVPSGYEVPQKGVLPQFYAYFSKNTDVRERFDFDLRKVDQSRHRMLFFGDMHLANRSTFKDIAQFESFTDDVNALLDETSVPTYALTLGDMSWDIFWIQNRYDLASYLKQINKDMGERLQIFHTMGNHDNDPLSAGDFDCEAAYKSVIGPTYYSFNVGGVHYMVLDDILCRNDGSGERSYYANITSDEGEWIVSDLKFVPKSTPLVLTMHAPLYKMSGELSLYNGFQDLISLLRGYKSTFVTGHTHVVYNVDRSDNSVSVYESNSGAVCGGWWVSWSNSGIHLGGDGAPGGYRIMDVDDSSWKWVFKGTQLDDKVQFRSYDRNTFQLTAAAWTPNASPSDKVKFESTVGDYACASNANEILVNVWDWDPSWKVEMTENGKALNVKRLSEVKDPLYLVCYEAYQYNHGWSVSYPCYTTNHIFSANASSATSTVDIKVTDRYGRVYTERMQRPKQFSIAAYR